MEKSAEKRRPRLVYQNVFGEKRVLALAGPIVIGRSRQASLAIPDNTVSEFHCGIIPLKPPPGSPPDALVWLACDLGSMNGTWLNGHRLTRPALLRHGDWLQFGRTHATRVLLRH